MGEAATVEHVGESGDVRVDRAENTGVSPATLARGIQLGDVGEVLPVVVRKDRRRGAHVGEAGLGGIGRARRPLHDIETVGRSESRRHGLSRREVQVGGMVDRAVLVNPLLSEVAVVRGGDTVVLEETRMAALQRDTAGDFPALFRQAGKNADRLAKRIVLQRVGEGHVNRRALVVLFQDHVEHAGDRIRAVDRGRAVLQILDALDSGRGNAVEIENGLRRAASAIGERIGDGPAAVDEREHAIRTEPAGIDRRRAGDEAAGGELGNAGGVIVGQALHELAERGIAFFLDRRGREGDDRRGRLVVEPPDAGAGDLEGLECFGRGGILDVIGLFDILGGDHAERKCGEESEADGRQGGGNTCVVHRWSAADGFPAAKGVVSDG